MGHPAEMAEICEILKLPHKLEMNKAYPRDWLIRGRVRVMLKTPEGAFTHAELHTKKAVMLKMAELIPKLKSRAGGPPQGSTPPGAPAGASGAAAGNNKAAKKEAKREEKK